MCSLITLDVMSDHGGEVMLWNPLHDGEGVRHRPVDGFLPPPACKMSGRRVSPIAGGRLSRPPNGVLGGRDRLTLQTAAGRREWLERELAREQAHAESEEGARDESDGEPIDGFDPELIGPNGRRAWLRQAHRHCLCAPSKAPSRESASARMALSRL